MVSKAREDLPEPDRPVMTTNRFLGISKEIFFRLWTLAPLILMKSVFILFKNLVLWVRSGFIGFAV